MSKTINWIFGRGLSIGCGLNWSVPDAWRDIPRDEAVRRIKTAILEEMNSSNVDTSILRCFLRELSSRTVSGWNHKFITTNWDFLLQKEIDELGLEVQPAWLSDSKVWHLNGSVEGVPDESLQSPFLLETDRASARVPSYEVNVIFNQILWGSVFFVVGMSFECEMDRFLLQTLNKHEDNVPVGESMWFVMNPDQKALGMASARIKAALPNARVYKAPITFDTWIKNGMVRMRMLGVFD